MSHTIDPSHPLFRYHRRRPALAGRSPAELSRQWGWAEVAGGVPEGGFPAGAYGEVTIRFHVGSMGLDEDGGIKFSFRFVSDAATLQSTDPTADGYVSAKTAGRADLEVQVERKGTVRPFQRTVFVHVRNATLRRGDAIDVVLGDTAGGGRGWRQQTYFEKPFPVRVAVDPLGTHDYHELPYDLGWDIVPGQLARYVVNAPSIVTRGQEFRIRVKGEDEWGNPLRELAGTPPELLLLSGGESGGEARPLDVPGNHEQGVWSFTASLDRPGSYRLQADGQIPSISNGFLVLDGEELPPYGFHWCDLHGQTGETVGAGTIEEYFHFGRHYSFLDGSVHQGNDFQIGLDLWEHIKRASHDAYRPGEFVTFPGYEWSGTEAMGGDHNVIYFEEDPPIYRSTGWLDANPFEENAPLPRLYDALRDHQAMTIAHVGGRPASFTESDPALERLWEIHSAWGTFEWVYKEAFERKIKVGFVCNSDGHKCRPGASFPGAGIFGTLGGLTCVLSRTRDRQGFWEALRARRTYGTTGQRIIVDADLEGNPIGSDVSASRGRVRARILGSAPIVRVDLLRASEVIASHVPAADAEPDTLLLRFGGARVKGRARMIKWTGSVSLSGNRFTDTKANGIFSPIYGITKRAADGFEFTTPTTGNLVNFELGLDKGMEGTLRFESNQTSFSLDLANVGREPQVLFEAPLDQLVEVVAVNRSRLPLAVETAFDLEFDHDEELPYFLRVTQVDEGKAWTSPFYVRSPSRTSAV